MLYMFRTVLVHHQEQLYTNYGMQLQNVAPDDGLKSPKHVEHLKINKDIL